MIDRMRHVASLALVAALMCGSSASASVINSWIEWTAPASYPFSATGQNYSYTYSGSANGTLQVPGIGNVTASLAGEVINPDFVPPWSSTFGSQTNEFWASENTNGTTYISANVPALPPNSDRIAVAGFGISTQTLTFSQPITNLVMNLWSLGSPSTPATWNFSSPFVVLSANPAGFSVNGNSITGSESNGTIQFYGQFSSLSWTIPQPEVFAVWNIGATSAAVVPEPSTGVLIGAAVCGLAVAAQRARSRKRAERTVVA